MADDDSSSLSGAVSHLQLAGDTSSPFSFSPPSPAQLRLAGTRTTSSTGVDASPAATDPNAAPSAPPSAGTSSEAEEADYELDFLVTPLKDDCNQFAYNPATDKQRGPFLIGKSAMGPRFCEYPIDKFMNRVPGVAPTAEDRKKFEQVNCSKASLEKHWCTLLNKTANSVFDASGKRSLAFLDTSTHRAAEPLGPDGKKPQTRTQTLNDAGIYWDTGDAHDATKLTDEQIKNSKFTLEQLQARGRVGARNWHWVAIPMEIKHDKKKTAFTFRNPVPKKSSTGKPSHPPPSTAAEDDPVRAHASSAPSDVRHQAEQEGEEDSPSFAADGPEPAADAPGAQHPDPPEKQKSKKFVGGSAEAEAALAQFAEYMLNVLNYQHREFCYGIYIWQRMARLCYFDRGGAIVSQDFDWISTDSPLHDFLWRVANMSRDDLGYDPTAVLLKKKSKLATRFRDMASNSAVPPAVQNYVRAATAEGVPIYKLSIIPMAAPPDEGLPDEPSLQADYLSSPAPEPVPLPSDPSSGPASPSPIPDSSPSPPVEPVARHFLVGMPHFVTNSLVGRCTRGYVAYEIETGCLCFLKDYWRPYVPGRTRPEHLVLELLNRSEVRHVATLLCGGDVGGLRAQQTKVQKLLVHMKAPPVPRIHYRLATQEIGLPLEDFKDFRQLASVFRDAILAHQDAWIKVKVLHRDISVGNIIIDALTKRGILIDWDLARFQCELASGPTEPDRTGTWQFRSALLLGFPRKPQRVSDDLESFVHAFYYLVLKYHPTTTTSLREFVETAFEGASVTCGVKVGGQAKLAHFQSVRPPFKAKNNPVLQSVLDAFHKGCYKSYRQLDLEKVDELYGIHDPALDEPPRAPDAGEYDEDDHAFSDDEPEDSNHATTSASASQAGSAEGSSVGDEAPYLTDISERGHSDTSRQEGTEGDSDSEASDPCVVTGFLSDHQHLAKVLRDKYKPAKPLCDKRPNRFRFRSKELAQDILKVVPRPASRDISSLSVSHSQSIHSRDFIPSNLYYSQDYSSSDLPTFASATGKRRRESSEDEDEESLDDNTPEEENTDIDSNRSGRKKRKRVAESSGSGVL